MGREDPHDGRAFVADGTFEGVKGGVPGLEVDVGAGVDERTRAAWPRRGGAVPWRPLRPAC